MVEDPTSKGPQSRLEQWPGVFLAVGLSATVTGLATYELVGLFPTPPKIAASLL